MLNELACGMLYLPGVWMMKHKLVAIVAALLLSHVSSAAPPLVVPLTNQNFEPLTQASTGQTTGVW